MELVRLTKNSIKILIGCFGFLGTFHAMIELMCFLSYPTQNTKDTPPSDNWSSTSWTLIVNMLLLTLFIVQHSLLASASIKDRLRNWGLSNLYRSLYVITTVIVLQVLIRNWHGISEITFWKHNLNFSPFWWLFVSLQAGAWILIYVGNICMDVNELLGIKQIYYSISKLPDPNARKSVQLQRLNSHMRHPSFLGFLIIFWSFPVMSLDRFLLAVICTLYMFVSWNTDQIDYAYQHSQYIRKFHELERLRS